MGLEDLLGFLDLEKLIKNFGVYTPIAIYGILLYLSESKIFYLILLIISLIIGVFFIINKEIMLSESFLKNDKDWVFKKIIQGKRINNFLNSLCGYLILIHLLIASCYSIKNLILFNSEANLYVFAVLLVLTIICLGSLIYIFLKVLLQINYALDVVRRVDKRRR